MQKNRIPLEAASPVGPQYPLFDHQRVALLKTLDFLQQKENPRVLLDMLTGG
jgi:hypothetical protein